MKDMGRNMTSGAPVQKWPTPMLSTDGKMKTRQRSETHSIFSSGEECKFAPQQTHYIHNTVHPHPHAHIHAPPLKLTQVHTVLPKSTQSQILTCQSLPKFTWSQISSKTHQLHSRLHLMHCSIGPQLSLMQTFTYMINLSIY
jgi:hypothetical protein